MRRYNAGCRPCWRRFRAGIQLVIVAGNSLPYRMGAGGRRICPFCRAFLARQLLD